MSIVDDLEALGFTVGPESRADAFVQDDGDGSGPFIAIWRSEQPCPFPHLLRARDPAA